MEKDAFLFWSYSQHVWIHYL